MAVIITLTFEDAEAKRITDALDHEHPGAEPADAEDIQQFCIDKLNQLTQGVEYKQDVAEIAPPPPVDVVGEARTV